MIALPGPKYSLETKQRFFDLLDRGGTIRAAADEAGVNRNAAYSWVRNAGIPTGRNAPRVYSSEEKAEFFRRLNEQGNVSAVARQLGFNRVTCYKWAHQAGIYTSEARAVNPRREEFLRLRSKGLTRSEAATAVNADARSAADWDKGITIIHRGRVYPNGRVVRYPKPKQDVVKTVQTALGEEVSLAQVEKVIDCRYLSLIEREQLRDLHREGMSIRKIAAAMGRSASTISRELRRNTVTPRGYLPHTAHRLSAARRQRKRPSKIVENNELFTYVHDKLQQRWSPEQIANRLRKDFPNAPHMWVCTETIYQAIYVHGHARLKRDGKLHLRRGRARRKPRANPNSRRQRFVDPMKLIEHRPTEVDNRVAPGHWEGDLIIGTNNRSAIITLVERTSRLLILGHLGRDRSAEAVCNRLISITADLPEPLKRTLTWDQGGEMAEHQSFADATKIDVYFCNPASPWQRGSNENTNGLIRQYFPKGTDLSRHSPEELATVAAELNARPRKSLNWDTPTERVSDLLVAN